MNVFVIIIALIVLYMILELLAGVYKYLPRDPLDLKQLYGDGWVVITGGSSGQGKQFALQLAALGFKLILIGSPNSYNTASEVKELYGTESIVIEKNFNYAYELDFFEDIAQKIQNLDISILINNVGHRTGWIPSHSQPEQDIIDTISCGTFVQTRLSNLIIPMMLKRQKRSSIVFITAQCMMNGSMWDSPEISVPYLGVYEASNAFGFYHACSIYKEYGNAIDIMNVMPGAVVTDNTSYLDKTIFSIQQDKFVKNIISMMGRVKGNTCGYWKHALASNILPNVSFIKEPILENVGKTIAKTYMEKTQSSS